MELVFVRVHVGGDEMWVNARRILSITWGTGPVANGVGRAGSVIRMNYGPAIVTQEDPDEVLDMLRQASGADG